MSKIENSKPYVVLGNRTHFEYDEDTSEVWCTHGGWVGILSIDPLLGACYISFRGLKTDIIEFDCYEFTDCSSYDEYFSIKGVEGGCDE